MTDREPWAAVKQRLLSSGKTDFASLVKLAGLDPARHMRFAEWSGADFSGSDLRGFDFTGARLIGCNFKGARIEGARFDQALIDEARPGAKLHPHRTYLRAARDWDKHVQSWKKADEPAPEYLPPGTVFQDAPFAPELIVIPAGRFFMGSKDGEGEQPERPRHEVTIPQAFAVGRFPVTGEEWDDARAAGALELEPRDERWGRDRQPLTNVSWDDAQTYLSWLSRVTDKPYRLLSEAEWEYACRAGTDTAYFFGESISKAQAQFRARGTVEVGFFPANNFGLCDMHGNIYEWCKDCWNESYAGKPESLRQTGGAWTTGDVGYRVLRGGSWGGSPQILRSAYRSRLNSGVRNKHFGFRVARTLLSS